MSRLIDVASLREVSDRSFSLRETRYVESSSILSIHSKIVMVAEILWSKAVRGPTFLASEVAGNVVVVVVVIFGRE